MASHSDAGRHRAPGLPPVLAVSALAAGVSPADLRWCEAEALRLGVPADFVLVGEGFVAEEALYGALAHLLGLPFLHDLPPVDTRTDPVLAQQAGFLRCVAADPQDITRVLAPRGAQLAVFLDGFRRGFPPGCGLALTTPGRLRAELLRRHGRRFSRDAASSVAEARPDLSARGRPGAGATTVLAAMAAVLLALPSEWPLLADLAALGLAAVFLATLALRMAAACAPPARSRPSEVLADKDLPTYTVLVPLYREARLVRQLTSWLMRLDYPKAKLDIRLLLEEDDFETRAALEQLGLPGCFEIVVCPPGRPRTKPRALNIGLGLARGDLLVVFDAEDRPDPRQLRQAAGRFAAADPRLACLQASLVIDNAREGWLPRLFRLEYATLFDVVLPGLDTLALPLPLGGTSNHFRTGVLRDLKGWDAWNVTEDADLGLRLARLGYRTETLASATLEAAQRDLRTWFGQRARWLKGWMQTALVHRTASGQALLGYGGWQRAAVVIHSSGTVLSALGFPVGLLALAAWAFLGVPGPNDDALARAAFHLAWIVPLLGCAGMAWPAVLAARRRVIPFQPADILLLVPYYLLVSAAAWWALAELFSAPSYWRKTEHRESATGPVDAPGGSARASAPAVSPRPREAAAG